MLLSNKLVRFSYLVASLFLMQTQSASAMEGQRELTPAEACVAACRSCKAACSKEDQAAQNPTQVACAKACDDCIAACSNEDSACQQVSAGKAGCVSACQACIRACNACKASCSEDTTVVNACDTCAKACQDCIDDCSRGISTTQSNQ
jgi:hypothetical protein